jgi:hypothetical protein
MLDPKQASLQVQALSYARKIFYRTGLRFQALPLINMLLPKGRRDSQNNDTQHGKYAERHYAKCQFLYVVILSVVMLNVVILSVAALPKGLGKLTWEEGSREGAKKAKKAQKGPKRPKKAQKGPKKAQKLIMFPKTKKPLV